MASSDAVAQCCERIETALAEENIPTLHRHLSALTDLLESASPDEPVFEDIRDETTCLAKRAEDLNQITTESDLDSGEVLTTNFSEDVTALTCRVCRKYLEAADIDTPATMADHSSKLDTLEELLDILEGLDTDNKQAPDFESVEEIERRQQQQAEKIDEMARQLGDDK